MLSVRTTVRIDDDLYRCVKARAATEGRTVAAVLEDAVRIGMTTDQRAASERFRVRAHGSGGVLPGVDLASNPAVREVLDQGVGLEQMR
jgi:plasmid stability protein